MTGRRHLSAQRRCAVLVERAADATRRVRAASRSDAGQKLRGARRRRSTLKSATSVGHHLVGHLASATCESRFRSCCLGVTNTGSVQI